MIFINKPTKKEVSLLEHHYQKAGSQLVRQRAHCILLSADGYNAIQIGGILRRQDKVIRYWIHSWNKQRISSIFHEYIDKENASKLTKEQKEEIKKTLGNLPSKQGLPGSFWSLPKFKDYISAQFGIVYESNRSYHYLLKYSHLSWKLPSPFDIKRDERQIQQRMKEIIKEIQPFLDSDEWEVFTQDETRLNWEEEIRRAWLRTGEKTVIKLSRNKIAQSYFGALNQKTGVHHLIELDWQDTDNIINALIKLSKEYKNKKLCIIWDNAAWHKSKKLREKLRVSKSLEHVHLINLPPYAPDNNPEEHVWKYGKERVANEHFETFDKLKTAFKHAVTSRIFDYKIGEFVLR